MPLISTLTLLSSHSFESSLVLMLTIVALYLIVTKTEYKIVLQNVSLREKPTNSVTIDCVENKIIRLSIRTCRVWLYMMTCVGILAVDFQVYPRRLAKTETYGISLMDLGVGFYIVCHAAKIIRNQEESDPSNFGSDLKQLPIQILNTLKSSSILIVIGVMRFISIKSTGYVEHVSEYGIHWNFLCTIVVVKVRVNKFLLEI